MFPVGEVTIFGFWIGLLPKLGLLCSVGVGGVFTIDGAGTVLAMVDGGV